MRRAGLRMRDQVFIDGLQGDTCIGVYDWERQLRQRVVLDMVLFTTLDAAGRSDDLRQTVDYKSVSDRVLDFVGSARFELIESLAEALSRILLSEFSIDAVTLRISKPGAVPDAANVGVSIHRERTSEQAG